MHVHYTDNYNIMKSLFEHFLSCIYAFTDIWYKNKQRYIHKMLKVFYLLCSKYLKLLTLQNFHVRFSYTCIQNVRRNGVSSNTEIGTNMYI